MKEVILLGSTGSVGSQAVDVLLESPSLYRVKGLAATGRNAQALSCQCLDLSPDFVALSGEQSPDDFLSVLHFEASKRGLGNYPAPTILCGPKGVEELASASADVVLNAITGAAGLSATVATLTAGTTLALANKESLVIGGEFVSRLAKPGQIVPVDSEHSALAQALRGERMDEVSRLVLTASGGPFFNRSRDDLKSVTLEDALNHPTWAMGPVITINSATLMNKGLEIIEAHLLFGVDIERISVVVSPQSVVHSMVDFHDGATMAQLSVPSMKLAISLGLSWPARNPNAVKPMDWTRRHTIDFIPVDEDTFSAIRLARLVGQMGGSAPAVFNAANEVCVEAFRARRISFLDIMDTVEAVIDRNRDYAVSSLGQVLEADLWARETAMDILGIRLA